MLSQFNIIHLGNLESLEKAHVKAHFRRDAKTGKLIFIQNYDSKVHGKADHEVHAGHTMVVDNPKSKHHGKKAVIRGYHVPNGGKRKPYVACTVDGVRSDLQPHHFKPHTGGFAPAKAAPAKKAPPVKRTPVKAPATFATSNSKKITKMIEAKNELRLIGRGYNSPEMKVAELIVSNKTDADLSQYVQNVTSAQRLYDVFRALERNTTLPVPRKRPLLDEMKAKIIQMAQEKVDGKTTPAKKTPSKAQTPQKPATIPAPAQNAATGTAKHNIGDIVEIQTGKYTGKKGKITHMGGKYGVRVRVDLTGTGNYTKVAEYKKPDKSFKVQTAATPAPAKKAPPAADPKSDKTRGKDKKKRKPRSDKGTGKPDEPADAKPQAPEDPMAFLRDRNLAYKHADNKLREIGKKVGVLPTDPKAAEYMQKNMHLLTQANKWVKTPGQKGQPGGNLPRWAKADFYSHQNTAHDDAVAEYYMGSSRRAKSAYGAVFNASKGTWEKAGYDYSDVKDDIAKIKNNIEEAQELHKDTHCLSTLNQVANAVIKTVGKKYGISMSSYWSDMAKYSHSKGYDADTPISILLADKTFLSKAGISPVHERADQDILDMAKIFAFGIDKIGKDITMRDMFTVKQRTETGTLDARGRRDIEDASGNSFVKSMHQAWQDGNRFRQGIACDSRWIKDELSKNSWAGDTKRIMKLLDGDPSGVKNSFLSHDLFYNMIGVASGLHRDENAKIASSNPAIKDQVQANAVMKQAFTRYNSRASDTFTPTMVHKGVLADHTPRYAGLTIARRKGSPEDINTKMAKKHIAAAKKAAKAGNKPDPTDTADNAGVKAVLQSVDDKTFKMVEKRLQQSFDRGTHGGFGIKVNGIYQIGGMDVYDKHAKNVKDQGNVKFMYHGTDVAAAASIIKTGFAVPKAAKAGRMLGNGVYVTPCSSKAAQYLSDNFTRRVGSKGIMFVNKCVMGKQYNAPQHHYPHATPGYHSIFVKKGQYGILNEEHAIRDPNSVLPTFWVDVELTKP